MSKIIWDNLVLSKNTITAKYLPRLLNIEADSELKELKDSRKWKLDPQVFKKVCLSWGTENIKLFVSRFFHQIPQYMSWTLDPFSKSWDTSQKMWNKI